MIPVKQCHVPTNLFSILYFCWLAIGRPKKRFLGAFVEACRVVNLKCYVANEIHTNLGKLDFTCSMRPQMAFGRNLRLDITICFYSKLSNRPTFDYESTINHKGVVGRSVGSPPSTPFEKRLTQLFFALGFKLKLHAIAPICQILEQEQKTTRYCANQNKNKCGCRHTGLTRPS